MGLPSGKRIGAYEIVAPLGAGGMGEVYRARDTRLGRDVALKVLPASVAGDADRLRRFEQEARATGALNHPNVLAVYDVGEHEGTPFLVTELLEGATLRERLQAGPLPPRKALEVAGQIARGLAAAHEKGIVHRDLKPENLFVTKDGRVKILDFGLAKAVGGEVSATESTLAETEPGAVLGTAGYMAPEQVRGKPADARADIFAFGAVLYEMLAGKRAFPGDTAIDRAHAILNKEPAPLAEAGVSVPPAVERVLQRCLEKAPDERFHSAADLGFALEALSDASSAGTRAVDAPAPRRPTVVLVLTLLLVVFGVGGVLAGRWLGRHDTTPPSRPAASQPKYTRALFRRGHVTTARFAPDGRTVVLAGSFDGAPWQVFSATPGHPEIRALSGPDTDLYAVSSTGEMALTLLRPSRAPGATAGTLAVAALAGGAPREIAEDVIAADWGPGGAMLVVRCPPGTQRAAGDKNTRIEYPMGTVLYQTPDEVDSVRVSPRGDHVAFVERTRRWWKNGSIVVVGRDRVKRTLSGPWSSMGTISWSADGGEILFTAGRERYRDSTLRAVTLGGQERVLLETPDSLRILDVAADGRVLLGRVEFRHRVAGLPPGGSREVDLSYLDNSDLADLSKDGRHLLLIDIIEGEEEEVSFLRETTGTRAIRLGPGVPSALSPDGLWAATVLAAADPQVALLPTGPGERRALPVGSASRVSRAFWFPDGKKLLLVASEPRRPQRLWVQEVAGGPPRPLSDEGTISMAPPSPDGRTVATFDRDGRVYLLPLEGGAAKPLAGLAPFDVPIQWSADGRGLFVRRVVTARANATPPAADGWFVTDFPVEIFRYDIAGGRREPWRTIVPEDRAGLLHIDDVLVTPDGSSYAYSYMRDRTELYVVEGLR